MYNFAMRFTWDETKRQAKLAKHGLDFLVALIVHVESHQEIRIISMRKADSDETDLYYRNAGYF